MRTVIKPSELEAETGKILDQAIKSPQYVERNGVLLVITIAELVTTSSDDLVDAPRRNRILKNLDDSESW